MTKVCKLMLKAMVMILIVNLVLCSSVVYLPDSGKVFAATGPSTPTGLKVISKTATSVTLQWNPSSGGVGEISYVVTYYDMANNHPYDDGILSGNSMTITDLNPDSWYYFTVYAYDDAFNVSGTSNRVYQKTPASEYKLNMIKLLSTTPAKIVVPTPVATPSCTPANTPAYSPTPTPYTDPLEAYYNEAGSLYNMFDDNTSTNFRANAFFNPYVNPTYIQFSFASSQTISKIRLHMSLFPSSYTYHIEVADNENGPYTAITSGKKVDSNGWGLDTFSTPITKQHWKILIETSEPVAKYIDVDEIEFWSNAPRTQTIDNTDLNVGAAPFYSSVKLSWNNNINKNDIAGYAVFRRTGDGNFTLNDLNSPVRRIAKDCYNSQMTLTDCNLIPGTHYYYKIAPFNREGDYIGPISDIDTTTLTSNANIKKVYTLSLLVPMVYRYKDSTNPYNNQQLAESIKEVAKFIYRNSYGKLNIQPTFLAVDENTKYISPYIKDLEGMEGDLKSRGICQNEYDLVYPLWTFPGGDLGPNYANMEWLGAIGANGTKANYGWYSAAWQKEHLNNKVYTNQIWTSIHELTHAFAKCLNYTRPTPTPTSTPSSTITPMLSPTPTPTPFFPNADTEWSYGDNPNLDDNWPDFVAGERMDTMAQFYRYFTSKNLLDSVNYDKILSKFNYIEYIDSDGDGLADSDDRLPADEGRFAVDLTNPTNKMTSDETKADTDGDGLDDMQEFCASYSKGSDPRKADTDGDGYFDGNDTKPLNDFNSPVIRKFTQSPVISNSTVIDEMTWTRLSSSQEINGRPDDPNYKIEYYSGWDDNYIYFGVKSPEKTELRIRLDASGQNGYFETDGHFNNETWRQPDSTFYADTYNFGDCYTNGYTFVIDPTKSNVYYLSGSPITNSQVGYHFDQNSNTYILVCRIPKSPTASNNSSGHGVAKSWWPKYMESLPEYDLTGIRLSPNRVIGLQFVSLPFGSNTISPYSNGILNVDEGINPSDISAMSTMSLPGTYYNATLGACQEYWDFKTSGTTGWTQYGGSWYVNNGEYALGQAGPGYKSIIDGTSYINFTYEAQVTIDQSQMVPGSDAGIIFRVSNPLFWENYLNGYGAYISTADNNVKLVRYDSQETTVLATYSCPNVKYNPGSKHLIRVTAWGSYIKVYVDNMDVPVIDIMDNTYSSGSIGLRAYNTLASFNKVLLMTPESLFYEDFNTDNAWIKYDQGWTIAAAGSENEYSVTSGSGKKAIANTTNYGDIVYDAKVCITGGSGSAGTIFRVTDATTGTNSFKGYEACISSQDNSVALYRYDNGIKTQVKKVTVSPFTITANENYRIRVEAKGPNIRVYVSDKADMTYPAFIEAQDTSYACGSIGLRADNVTARFDKVYVIKYKTS